jgi:hypothetical protein
MILRDRSGPISCPCPGRNGFQPTPVALTEDTLADGFRIARHPELLKIEDSFTTAKSSLIEWGRRFGTTTNDVDPAPRETGSRPWSCPLLDIVLHSWTSVAPRAFQIQRAPP